MPSERPRDGWLERTWLRSQGLGVVCGLSAVALLAVGSFVLVATADGASSGVAMDDIRPFFKAPSIVHLWFYLLAAVFGVYTINTVLATVHSVWRKISAGVRAPSSYAPAVIHVSFLFALVAHLAGGLFGEELAPIILAGSFQPLGDGRQARVVRVDREDLPNGMPKTVLAHLEVQRGDGAVESAVVGYNQPLSEGFGARLYLLSEAGEVTAARLRLGDDQCEVQERGECRLAGRRVELLAMVMTGSVLTTMVRITPENGGAPDVRRLSPGRSAALSGGGVLWLEGFDQQPAVALRGRRAPGNPWALVSASLLAIGIVMMARRLAPRE